MFDSTVPALQEADELLYQMRFNIGVYLFWTGNDPRPSKALLEHLAGLLKFVQRSKVGYSSDAALWDLPETWRANMEEDAAYLRSLGVDVHNIDDLHRLQLASGNRQTKKGKRK